MLMKLAQATPHPFNMCQRTLCTMVEMIHSWLFAQSKGCFSHPFPLVKGKSPQRSKVDPSYQSVYISNITSPLARWVFGLILSIIKKITNLWKPQFCAPEDSSNGISMIPTNLLSKPAGFIVLSAFLLFPYSTRSMSKEIAHWRTFVVTQQ
jgi:hypothetical protein